MVLYPELLAQPRANTLHAKTLSGMMAGSNKANTSLPSNMDGLLRHLTSHKKISPRVGSELVSQTDRVRVWHLSLKPGERIGFHRHVLDYFWTATSAGRSRSHFGDGQIIESEYETGTTRHFSFAAGESMVHDLENIGSSELTFVTIEFKNSDNAPLPLDL